MDVEITLDLDGDLIKAAEPPLTERHLSLEELIVCFMRWCVTHPDEAQETLLRWQAEAEEQ